MDMKIRHGARKLTHIPYLKKKQKRSLKKEKKKTNGKDLSKQ